jgi:hypothetical protein
MLRRSSVPTPQLQSTRYGDDKDVDGKFNPYSTIPIYQVWGWQGCGWEDLSLLHHYNLPGYGDDKDVSEKFYPYSTTPVYQVWGWQGCEWEVLSLLHHSSLPGMGMSRMWMRRSIHTPPLQFTRYMGMTGMWMRRSIPTPQLQSTWYGDVKDVDETFYPYSTHSNLPGMGMTRMWMRRSIPTPPLQSTRYGDDKDVDGKFNPYSTIPIYQVWGWQGCGLDVLSLLHNSNLPGMEMTRMWVRSSIPTPPFPYNRYGDDKDVDETFYPYSTTPIYQVYGDDRNVDETFYPYSTHSNLPGMGM